MKTSVAGRLKISVPLSRILAPLGMAPLLVPSPICRVPEPVMLMAPVNVLAVVLARVTLPEPFIVQSGAAADAAGAAERITFAVVGKGNGGRLEIRGYIGQRNVDIRPARTRIIKGHQVEVKELVGQSASSSN